MAEDNNNIVTEETEGKKKKIWFKVLVTGKNRKIATDICEHLENDRGYLTVKCSPSKTALFDALLAELPKVVIICLGDETDETVKAYNVLKEANRQGSCATIVVTNEDDEKIFIKYSELSKVSFLSRPVSLFALYEKMMGIEKKFQENADKNMSAFREWENENADKDVRKKILIVDDDTEQLIHIKEQLREFYDVTAVKSGSAALKSIMKRKPDLILLDYLMPDDDGPVVFKKIKAFENFADIPIIFLTGMTEKSAVIETLTKLRPEGYIIKPSKKSELVAKIIDILG
ncbi:MAG: response regulator [Lachnospiraceae bacterium]|nr:response regulator [Lachnospiraceae bacterium]